MEKARELARAAADKAAEKVRGVDEPLGKALGVKDVLTPPAFSYFDPLSVLMFRWQGQPLEYGEIQGVEGQQSDTIKKQVALMQVGDVGVVHNDAKSVYYVVRVAGETGGGEEGRKEFMQAIVDAPGDGPPPEVMYVSQYNIREVLFDWYKEVEKEYDVQWVDAEFRQRALRES